MVMLFLVTFAMPAGKKKEPLPGPSRCVLIILLGCFVMLTHANYYHFDFQNECKYLR